MAVRLRLLCVVTDGEEAADLQVTSPLPVVTQRSPFIDLLSSVGGCFYLTLTQAVKLVNILFRYKHETTCIIDFISISIVTITILIMIVLLSVLLLLLPLILPLLLPLLLLLLYFIITINNTEINK